MNRKISYLSKNLGLFTISTFGPKILSFLMVPLYTNCLTTAEYGIGELIITSVNLALPILMVCIDSGVLRFSLDKDYDTDKVFTNSLYILIRGLLFGFIGICIFKLIPFVEVNSTYLLFFGCFILANSTYNYLSCFSRGIDKVGIMVEMSIITTGATCLLNILFLPVLNLGINGYMVANFAGTYIATIWGILRLHPFRLISRKNIDKALIRELQQYSFPLIFNQIGWWINNSIDKYIVTFFLGANMNGIYSVSYKIPTILSTISGIFANAWSLSAIKEFDPDDKDHFVINMYNLYNTCLVICCSALLLINIPLAKILYAKDFFVAWMYTGPLMISVIFGAFAGFLGAIFSAAKDTKIYSFSTIVGGIVNIGVSLILVKPLGIMGVAFGTLFSNITIWAIRLHRSKQYIKLNINYKKDFLMYICLFIQFVIGLVGIKLWAISLQIVILIFLLGVNRTAVKKMLSTVKGMLFRNKNNN